MTVWAQEAQIFFFIVIGITVNVIYFEWNLVCLGITLIPTARSTLFVMQTN